MEPKMALRMDLRDAPVGSRVPRQVDAIVEIPRESRVKYEFDPPTGLFRVSRVLPEDMTYPVNYGFIPSTLADDGDCLDIMVLDSPPLQPGTVITLEVMGALHLMDRGIEDYKILGRPAYLSPYERDSADPDPAFLKIVWHFFQHYKELEKIPVEVLKWIGREQAKEIVRDAHERFRKKEPVEVMGDAFQ
ncbi:MAG: ppa [Fibrobacteres bacterium]|nr:ppa [Fibrobacterota bacterium]